MEDDPSFNFMVTLVEVLMPELVNPSWSSPPGEGPG